MTVIAGFTDGKVAYIGGDSGAFDVDSVNLTETKVWKTDDYLLGAAGGFRLAEIAYDSSIGDPYKLRDHLEAWWLVNASSQAENDTQFLVISIEGVWIIGTDFSVIRCRENYGAIGSGGLAAMSALFALQSIALIPRERITTALKASAYHTAQVRAPFKVISL